MGRVSSRALFPVVAAFIPAAAAAADLTELSLESLLETRVTSASKYEQSLIDVPAAVSVITRADIRAYGWRTLAQALATLPGVHGTYDRQYDYTGTRGFGLPGDFNTRLLLAVNGNRLNDIVYDSAGLGRQFPVDLDLIERIEFIPGPGGAVYGQNAMFGVINVITRNGLQVDGWEATTSWQQPQDMGEARLRWGRRFDGGLDLLVALGVMRSAGDDLLMTFPGAAADGGDITGVARGLDGEKDDELTLHAGHGAWTFDVRYSARTKDDPTGAYFSDPFVPGQYERDTSLLTHLQYQRDIGASWNLLGRLFTGRQFWSGMFQYDGIGNYSTGHSEWRGGEVRLLHTGYARHKLMVGMELQDNARIDQSNDDLASNLLITPLIGGATSDLLIEREGYRAGIYAQDEWQISDTVSTSLGLRLDRNDINGTRLSPRAALIWRTTPVLTLKTLYGRAQRAPNSYERDYDDRLSLVANPQLGRESIDTLEFVAERELSRAMSLRASLYRWRMNDFIQLSTDPASGLAQYQSGGDVEASGTELSANAAWNSGDRLRASLAWQNVSYATGARLANSPRWLGRLNYARSLMAGYDIGVELQYDGERQGNDGATLDGYWLTNVTVVADSLANGLEASLTLLNLFDTRYEHPAADTNWQRSLEQDGRALRLSLDYRF